MVANLLVLSISVALLVLTCVIYQKSRKKRTNIKYLVACLSLIAFSNTLVGIDLKNLVIVMILTILLPLGFIMLFFHYEGISRPRPRLSVFIYLLTLFIVSASFKAMILIYMGLNNQSFDVTYQELGVTSDSFVNLLLNVARLSQSILSCLVFLIAVFVMKKAQKIMKMRATIIELIGLVFLVVYGALYVIRDLFFYANYDLLTSIALIFSLIGLLLIVYNFLVHPDYLYLLPFPIFKFMIFNENGISCYVRSIEKTKDGIDTRGDMDQLMAGAFTAISNMFKEVLGAGTNIRYIDADKFIIFVTPLPQKRGVLVVISPAETALFKDSIKRFTRTLSPSLLEKINGVVEINELRPEIDALIRTSFPYVHFSQGE
ncbi:MAG: hypothetical protein JW891_16790 [Candidatus Lokiarchaeota archaeon]|nr:hypothetical protein [Candidatus Lokiarchaeota archaeon]